MPACVCLAAAGLCNGAERQLQTNSAAVCLAGRLNRKYSMNDSDEEAQTIWYSAEIFWNVLHSKKIGYITHNEYAIIQTIC